MLNFFRAPTLNHLDLYEATKLRLTWNMHLILIFALSLLALLSAINDSVYSFIYGGSAVLIAVSLLVIHRVNKFFISSTVLSAILYLTIIYSMFKVDQYIHYLEPFWALLVCLYVYFIHGKKWGGLLMVATIVSTVLFFFYRLGDSVEILQAAEPIKLVSKGVEFTICLSLIGYVIHKFLFLKKYAENELRRINEELRKEKELVESRNQEKTIMLQEIHHRVKNNLQIVMSLLRMQSDKIALPETKQHFNDAINRVLTMSLIHQKLYESDNLSAVDFSEYLESLASDVLRSSPIKRNIEKSFSIEVHELGMKTIVPVALIITELISNSMKHAFETTEFPKISLSTRSNSSNEFLEMIYSDNGRWKASEKDSFGTQLIEALTEQLEGSYKLTVDASGSTYTFQFKQLD